MNNIDELQRLHEAATKGEWKAQLYGKSYEVFSDVSRFWIAKVQRFAAHLIDGEDPQYKANAEFIVSAHNQLPALLERLRRAEAGEAKAWEEFRALSVRGGAESAASAKETAHLKAAMDSIWATIWDSHYGSGVTAEYAQAVEKEVRQALNTVTADAWLAARDARMKKLGAAEWIEDEMKRAKSIGRRHITYEYVFMEHEAARLRAESKGE